MLLGGGNIKSIMTKRGYKHRRSEDQLTVRGQYARNLQYVYSKEYSTGDGMVIDLIYFCVDILSEKLVIGLYRENPSIENGIYADISRSLDLKKYSPENIELMLDKMITPVREQFK